MGFLKDFGRGLDDLVHNSLGGLDDLVRGDFRGIEDRAEQNLFTVFENPALRNTVLPVLDFFTYGLGSSVAGAEYNKKRNNERNISSAQLRRAGTNALLSYGANQYLQGQGGGGDGFYYEGDGLGGTTGVRAQSYGGSGGISGLYFEGDGAGGSTPVMAQSYGGASPLETYLTTGGADGSVSSGFGGGSAITGAPETISGGGGFSTIGGSPYDYMSNYLRRMWRSPMGRYALTQGVGGLYGMMQQRKLEKELRNVDVTQQPGYQTGLQNVTRRMQAGGYGNSSNLLAALQDYGAQSYDRYGAERRAQYQAKQGSVQSMLNLLGMLSLGFGG